METKQPGFADEPRPVDGAPRKGSLKSPNTAAARALRRAAIAVALLALPGAALAATVKGRITGAAKLMNPVWNEAKESNAHRYTFREPSPTVRPDVWNLTGLLQKELCIAALGEKGAPLKAAYRVTIAGGRTTPVTLVVAEGQQIQFQNNDPFPHKLYEVSGKGGLVAAEILPTKSRAWTPPGPGKWEFKDELAPSVRSWIVVEPRTVAVAFPTKKGEFSMDLEPGNYKFRGYYNGDPVGAELAVTVGGVDLNLPGPLAVGEGSAASAADAGAGDGG
jgi:hypothetical protein